MKKKQASASTFRLNDEDRQALQVIREYYGATSDIAAMRIALRETVRFIGRQPPPSSPSERNKKP